LDEISKSPRYLLELAFLKNPIIVSKDCFDVYLEIIFDIISTNASIIEQKADIESKMIDKDYEVEKKRLEDRITKRKEANANQKKGISNVLQSIQKRRTPNFVESVVIKMNTDD
jgi:hypothetical protein